MKKILLILFLSPLFTLAQTVTLPVDSTTKTITYQEVVKVDGASKDDLYIRGREWFAKTFKSSNDVIQMDDKAAGKIIGKGLTKSSYTMMMTQVPFNVLYTISITVKEGRYRYEISSLNVELGTDRVPYSLEEINTMYAKGKGMKYNVAKRIIPFADETAQSLATSIKETLKQPASGVKSKDEF